MSYRTLLSLVSVGTLVIALTGCGGGTGPLPDAETSAVEGVVYLPADRGATEVFAADAAAQNPEPAAYCNVVCERERDRHRLGSTSTDGQGRYRFEGLPRGQDVTITAELPSGEQLRTRLRLRNRFHRVEISEGTATRLGGQQ